MKSENKFFIPKGSEAKYAGAGTLVNLYATCRTIDDLPNFTESPRRLYLLDEFEQAHAIAKGNDLKNLPEGVLILKHQTDRGLMTGRYCFVRLDMKAETLNFNCADSETDNIEFDQVYNELFTRPLYSFNPVQEIQTEGDIVSHSENPYRP